MPELTADLAGHISDDETGWAPHRGLVTVTQPPEEAQPAVYLSVALQINRNGTDHRWTCKCYVLLDLDCWLGGMCNGLHGKSFTKGCSCNHRVVYSHTSLTVL